MTSSPEIPVERFERIFYATKDRLYNFVRKQMKGHDATEDVVQLCYIKLWEKLGELQDDDNMLPLLSTYAINIIIDAIRREAKERVRAQLFHEQYKLTANPIDEMHLKEIKLVYEKAVASLPPKRRMIYRLVREEGLSHQQIASKLNISTNTIERQINEALHTLRHKLPADKLALLLLLLKL